MSGRSKDAVLCVTGQITHALKAEGADASEDGTGRGQPMAAVAIRTANTGANGHGISEEMAHTLDQAQGQAVIAFEPGVMSRCGGHHYEDVSGCLRKAPGDNQMAVMTLAIRGRGEESNLEIRQDGTANALRCSGGGGDKPHVLAFDTTQVSSKANYSNPKPGDPCHPLAIGAHAPAVAFRDTSDCLTAAYGTNWNGNSGADNGSLFAANAMQVRRLTPRECERLQGFPDDYTLIPWKGKPAEVCPDGPRYKALGNSMAVPCMRWIGERIKAKERRVGLTDSAPLPLLAMGGE